MRIIRSVFMAGGIVFALMGLVWMGQGSGYFPYPASSFMIDQGSWVTRGAMAFVGGGGNFLRCARIATLRQALRGRQRCG